MLKKIKVKIKSFFIKRVIGSKIGRFIIRFNDGFLKYWIQRCRFYRWISQNYSEFEFIDTQPDQEKRYRLSPQIVVERRLNLYRYLLKSEGLSGEIDYLEFGVAKGASLKWWLENNKNPQARFFGFDIFTGLPEKWDRVEAGTFSTGGKTAAIKDSRLEFKVGLFQDTLMPFLGKYPLKRKLVVHFDADLYTSTLFVLTVLAPYLKRGDVLIFDEFNSVLHEFRAFFDVAGAYRINYKLLGAANNFAQVALSIN